MLNLTDSIQSMKFTPSECLRMEINLNMSIHGYAWKDIGDVLYKFGIRCCSDTDNVTLVVSTEQFNFLVNLL